MKDQPSKDELKPFKTFGLNLLQLMPILAVAGLVITYLVHRFAL